MTESPDTCDKGRNGCFTLQEVEKKVLAGDTKSESLETLCKARERSCVDKFKELWSVVNEIRGLLWKFTLGLAALQISIQVIFKFLPIK
jgi:hypothetical protein